jgi:hypothetical protein
MPRTATLVLLLFLNAGQASAATGVWSPIGPMGGVITAIAIDRSAPRTVYTGTETGLVFKSLDGGGSWMEISSGLPNVSPVSALAIDPAAPATLYAGSFGIYKSTDGGCAGSRRVPAPSTLPPTGSCSCKSSAMGIPGRRASQGRPGVPTHPAGQGPSRSAPCARHQAGEPASPLARQDEPAGPATPPNPAGLYSATCQ